MDFLPDRIVSVGGNSGCDECTGFVNESERFCTDLLVPV